MSNCAFAFRRGMPRTIMYKTTSTRSLQQSPSRLFLFGSPPEPPKNSPANQKGKEGGGLFGGMGNIMESMKKAQEIAKQAEVVNKELMDTPVTGQDPSGQVVSTFNGLGVPIGLKVSDSILSQGSDAVSLACSQAMIDGHTKATTMMITRMQALYAGAGIPMPQQK